MRTSPAILAKAVVVACAFVVVILVMESGRCSAQTRAPANQEPSDQHPNEARAAKAQKSVGVDDEPPEGSYLRISDFAKGFLPDQKHIWTSPARLRFSD